MCRWWSKFWSGLPNRLRNGSRALLGFGIIFLFYGAGTWIHDQFAVPLPGNLIGMLLLFGALAIRIVRMEWVEQTAQMFLRHMLVFFAPLIVGVIAIAPLVADHLLGTVFSFLVSAITVLLVTGWMMHYSEKKAVKTDERN